MKRGEEARESLPADDGRRKDPQIKAMMDPAALEARLSVARAQRAKVLAARGKTDSPPARSRGGHRPSSLPGPPPESTAPLRQVSLRPRAPAADPEAQIQGPYPEWRDPEGVESRGWARFSIADTFRPIDGPAPDQAPDPASDPASDPERRAARPHRGVRQIAAGEPEAASPAAHRGRWSLVGATLLAGVILGGAATYVMLPQDDGARPAGDEAAAPRTAAIEAPARQEPATEPATDDDGSEVAASGVGPADTPVAPTGQGGAAATAPVSEPATDGDAAEAESAVSGVGPADTPVEPAAQGDAVATAEVAPAPDETAYRPRPLRDGLTAPAPAAPQGPQTAVLDATAVAAVPRPELPSFAGAGEAPVPPETPGAEPPPPLLAAPGESAPAAAPQPASGALSVPAAWEPPEGIPAISPPVASDIPVLAALDDSVISDPVRPPPAATNVRAVVHVPPDAGAAADAAVAALNGSGVGGVDRRNVNVTISRSNVRFFYAADREAAHAVSAILSNALGEDAITRDFTEFTPRPGEGLVEVWIAGNAPERAVSRPAASQRSTPSARRGSAAADARQRLTRSIEDRLRQQLR